MPEEIYEDDLMSGLTDETHVPCQMCGEMHLPEDVLKCPHCGYVACEECQEEHVNSADCPHVCTHCPACCASAQEPTLPLSEMGANLERLCKEFDEGVTIREIRPGAWQAWLDCSVMATIQENEDDWDIEVDDCWLDFGRFLEERI